MKILVLCIGLTLPSACAREAPLDASDVANPNATTAPLSEGSGVLLTTFDPDGVAPADVLGGDRHSHAASYTCPHHPDVVSADPGKCPKCKMDLEPKQAAPPSAHEGH